jgi:hypothetical protein
MQTVAETQSYLASAKAEGMTDAEMKLVIDTLAQDPSAGDLIVGAGGCRKVRIAGKGKGKSGGYRIVTVYGGGHMPLYLIAVLAKGSRSNFSKGEVSAMAGVAKRLIDAHRARRAG